MKIVHSVAIHRPCQLPTLKVRPKCQVKSVQYGFCTSGLHVKRNSTCLGLSIFFSFCYKNDDKGNENSQKLLKNAVAFKHPVLCAKRIDLSKHHNHQHSIIIIYYHCILSLTSSKLNVGPDHVYK